MPGPEVLLTLLANTAGTIAASQAAQSTAVTGQERFVITSVTAQAAQTTAMAGSGRFLATIVTAQQAQTESEAGLERFLATIGASQATQVAALVGTTTPATFAATIATTQAAQASSIAAFTPSLETLEPAAGSIFHLVIEEPAFAAIRTTQSRQRTHVEADTAENEEWLFFDDLSLAA